jgi:hypothetical protein
MAAPVTIYDMQTPSTSTLSGRKLNHFPPLRQNSTPAKFWYSQHKQQHCQQGTSQSLATLHHHDFK